jgi:hemerythrin-like domain-containing protein
MSALSPMEILEREHRHIEKVVKACFVTLEEIGNGGTIDAGLLRQIVEFMRVYADKSHHGKEEAQLFPALFNKGVPITGCPIGGLSGEHVMGRHLAGGLSDGIDLLERDPAAAEKTILENLRGITKLYPNHIWKEDYLLFPMTLKVMTGEELLALGTKFEKVTQSVGIETLQRYEDFADGLARRWIGAR